MVVSQPLVIWCPILIKEPIYLVEVQGEEKGIL